MSNIDQKVPRNLLVTDLTPKFIKENLELCQQLYKQLEKDLKQVADEILKTEKEKFYKDMEKYFEEFSREGYKNRFIRALDSNQWMQYPEKINHKSCFGDCHFEAEGHPVYLLKG